MENINSFLSSALFYGYGGTVGILAAILIFSLFLLIVGCLIKSQQLKSKFLKTCIYTFLMLGFILAIPKIIVAFKSFI